MKRIFCCLSLFLLAGCPGPGDRIAEKVTASVRYEGETVCITYPVKPGDRITSIQIGSDVGGEFYRVFKDNRVTPQAGDCLPVLDYPFEKDKNYTVYYTLNNDSHTRNLVIQANVAPNQ